MLSLSTTGVLKLLRMKTEDEEESVTEEEIKTMLKMGAESGTVEESEREMINEVFAIDMGEPQEETVDIRMLLEDLNEELSLSLASENYDTLSGCMIENLGYIPKENECAIMQTAHGKLYTEEVKDNRITRVRIEKNTVDVSEK